MSKLVVCVLALCSVAECIQNTTCSIMPTNTCWSNTPGKIKHVTTNASSRPSGADVCCPACAAESKCVSWTYIPVRVNGNPGCNLYKNNVRWIIIQLNPYSHSSFNSSFLSSSYAPQGPIKHSGDGCASGTFPKGPTPAPAPTPPKPQQSTPGPPVRPTGTHNILFIIDESTDSRAYFVGNKGQREETPMQLPNLARLMKEGTSFNNTYVHVPVCCPSRTTIAAGRFQHRIQHMQTNPDTGLHVNGAWNNHEGLDRNYRWVGSKCVD
jgi:hypothetical protein